MINHFHCVIFVGLEFGDLSEIQARCCNVPGFLQDVSPDGAMEDLQMIKYVCKFLL